MGDILKRQNLFRAFCLFFRADILLLKLTSDKDISQGYLDNLCLNCVMF